MIEAIHAQHARFMVSVWGKFYPVTENYKALKAIDGLYLTTITDHTRDWLNRTTTRSTTSSTRRRGRCSGIR